MGNKESPWETKPGETKGEGTGMGNKGGGHGKQRKGNITQGNNWGRAWEWQTKGKGTGGHGQRETKRAHGRAWATGNKGVGHGQRETKGGGHGNGKQRVYSRWRKDTSTADTINDLSFFMCLWYHLVGRKPDLLDDLVCPDGTTEQHLASGRLC